MHIFSSLRNLDLDEIPNENEAISKKKKTENKNIPESDKYS